MTLTLKAFSPADGMAIVHNGQRLRLFRPPYKLTNAVALSDTAVEDAVLNHGFHAAEQAFASWEEIIVFLNEQVATYRQTDTSAKPDAFSPIEMLEMAPLPIIERFLAKVENELIPQRQFEQANGFLLPLLKSALPQKHPSLTGQAAALLERIRDLEYPTLPNKAFLNQHSPFKHLINNNLTQDAENKASFIQHSHGFFGSSTTH